MALSYDAVENILTAGSDSYINDSRRMRNVSITIDLNAINLTISHYWEMQMFGRTNTINLYKNS